MGSPLRQRRREQALGQEGQKHDHHPLIRALAVAMPAAAACELSRL